MKRINKIAAARFFFVALSAALLLLGIFRGEAGIVFQKAARVCMECVGLG